MAQSLSKGLEAQRRTIAEFYEREGLAVGSEFIEVETDKGADGRDSGGDVAR